MRIDLNDMLQSYGLDSEYPESWKDSQFSSALANLGSNAVDENNSGALVEELLSAITTSQTVANDEEDPLGFSASIMGLLQASLSRSRLPKNSSERAIYMPSNTSFDARKYLNDVHSQASLNDLQRGLGYLRQKMHRNESGLRQMVDTDYENYVSTKRKLDDVMEQLHHIGVRNDTEFGFDELESRIDTATNQLTLCARPMDGFDKDKQRLENALKSIETHRKILELPQILDKHYKTAEHSQFVREYQRGQRMLDKLIQSPNMEERKLGSLISQRSQKIMEGYREQLHKQLLHTSADGPYAPLLTKLMDLGVSRNPANEWLNHNINRFSTEIDEIFNELQVTVNRNAADSVTSARKLDLVTYLRLLFGETSIIEASEKLDIAEHVDTEEAIGQWAQLISIFDNLRATLYRASVFYREFLSLVQNSSASSMGELTPAEIENLTQQCHKLVQLTSNKLVDCISTPVLSSLSLPIASEHTASARNEESQYCTLIPINSNSLAVAKYLGRILELLNAANDHIFTLFNNTASASNPLSHAIVTVKQQFVKALCDCWTRDAMILGAIQDWISGSVSNFPHYFFLYHGLLIEKLRFLLDSNRGGPSTPETVSYITRVFPAALSLSIKSVEDALRNSSESPELDAVQQAIQDKLQPSQLSQDSKLLVTLNNLETLRDSKLEHIYDQFETVIKQQKYTSSIRTEVTQEVNKIATQLFDIYIRKKKSVLSKVLREEIPRLIIEWREDNLNVTRVSNYIYECLMILVETHALFMESCPQLTRRAILDLYSHLLTNISEMLRDVEVLSRYGTLQNVTDLEYMRWAMSKLTETDKLCGRIFDDIKHASVAEQVWRDTDGLPRLLVMDVLNQAIKNSQFEFNCFKSMGN